MVFDPMERMTEARWHQAGLRAERENDRLAKVVQAERSGLSVRQARLRFKEALASVWIQFVCTWHDMRAAQAPSRC